MEIHAPEEPILTWKEFLVHLGTVTIGILIALALENLVEWNHHRHLVEEARENIRSEMQDNQKELALSLSSLSKTREDQQNVLRWATDLLKQHRTSIHSLSIGFNRADLSDSSWTTAQVTGALGLMQYAEVKRAAAVYQLQDEFVRIQTKAEDASISAMLLFSANADDPNKASEAELQNEKLLVENSLSLLQAKQQVGAALQNRYRAWLQPQK